MNAISFFLASLALLAPAVAPVPAGNSDVARVTHEATVVSGSDAVPAALALAIIEEARDTPEQRQVRIEERVIIRIAPSTAASREQMMAQIERRTQREAAFKEERFEGCVPIDAIARIMPTDENRLLLFMRDRRVLSAALERSCNSQDFYSGAYVERSRDGQLCSRREKLQSRTGATCQVARMSRLVADDD